VPPPTTWGKLFLSVAAIFICIYAITVVTYAWSVPDIGLRCIFSTDIVRVDGEPLEPEGAAPANAQYQIVAINDREVNTWPDLTRALTDLSPTTPTVQVKVRRTIGHEPRADDKIISVERTVSTTPFGLVMPSVLWFFLKGGLFFVGLLVFWKRPTDRAAGQFFLLSIVTVGAFMGGYHWWQIGRQPFLVLVFMTCAVFLPAVSLHFYLLFPRPKEFFQRQPLPTLRLLYAVPAVFLTVLIFEYFYLRALVVLPESSARTTLISDALATMRVSVCVYLIVAAGLYLGCVLSLTHSFRTTTEPTERNQVKWILFGALLASLPLGWSLYLVLVEPNEFAGGAATWPMFAASTCFTVAFTISITRYRLLQLDQVLNSGMAYFLILCLAGLVYYAIVFVAMLVVGSQVMVKPTLGQALIVSATALVLTLFLDLARSGFKKALDRRFRREKSHLDHALQRMGQTLEQLTGPPDLARRLLDTAAELLGARCGSVYLRSGEPPLYRLVGALGPAPALSELASGCPLVDGLLARGRVTVTTEPWSVAGPAEGQLHFLAGSVAQGLSHEGQLLALLVLGPKRSGAYTGEDFHLLAAFARLTSLALGNAERHQTIEALNRELQGKVEKISEQQRRILALQSQLTRRATVVETGPEDLSPPEEPATTGMIGSGPVVRQLLHLVRKVAASPSGVLIRGESGTGKELLARALHDHSPRAGKPFVKLHCAALSPGLLESELFGHVKGAFTGAHRDKVGRFELADAGTLFLDEIGDVTLEVQTKLLRVLQEMSFERVGSSDPVRVDVRVVAATHQDLERLIREGRFREDLYYRLNVITITVPALRERREDIPELVQHFLRAYAQRAGRSVPQMDDDAFLLLKRCPWPGNVRQLENVIERAVVVADGDLITIDDLPPELLTAAAEAPSEKLSPSHRPDHEVEEKEQLVRALAAAGGNKAEAARALGLARSTMLSRLKKHGLS
jgi:transcriptional regulator with GAF, ATPase, and Fis domain